MEGQEICPPIVSFGYLVLAAVGSVYLDPVRFDPVWLDPFWAFQPPPFVES